jgi:cellulose synthase/poly-beta-1,6-N-acetylglucosamine synthase-like glycosyltransferase
VTDGSSDQTPEIVSKYAASGVRLLHQPERRGKMAAIDRAMNQVNSDIVVFSDANNYYQSDTIQKLVAPFNDPRIGAVSGSKVIDKGDGNLGASEGLYWKYESFIKMRESRLDSCTSVSGEILAIRKTTYVSPTMNIINDDFFIAMQVIRQGYRLVYIPDARSFERVSLSAKDEIIRRTRINAGRYQVISKAFEILPLKRPLLVWQIISHKFLRPLVPFAMIFMLITNILLILFASNSPSFVSSLFSLGYPFGLAFLIIQVLFYISAWFGTLMTEHGDQSKIARLFYLPAFLTNSNFAALKGFIQFLRGSPTHIWDRIQRR